MTDEVIVRFDYDINGDSFMKMYLMRQTMTTILLCTGSTLRIITDDLRRRECCIVVIVSAVTIEAKGFRLSSSSWSL